MAYEEILERLTDAFVKKGVCMPKFQIMDADFDSLHLEVTGINSEIISVIQEARNCPIVDVEEYFSDLERQIRMESILIGKFSVLIKNTKAKGREISIETLRTLIEIFEEINTYFTNLLRFILGRSKNERKSRIMRSMQIGDFDLANYLIYNRNNRRGTPFTDYEQDLFRWISNAIETRHTDELRRLLDLVVIPQFFTPEEISIIKELGGVLERVNLYGPNDPGGREGQKGYIEGRFEGDGAFLMKRLHLEACRLSRSTTCREISKRLDCESDFMEALRRTGRNDDTLLAYLDLDYGETWPLVPVINRNVGIDYTFGVGLIPEMPLVVRGISIDVDDREGLILRIQAASGESAGQSFDNFDSLSRRFEEERRRIDEIDFPPEERF